MSIREWVFCLALLFFIDSQYCQADYEKPVDGSAEDFVWAVSVYNGIYSHRTFGETVFSRPHHEEDKYMHAIGLSKALVRFKDHFRLEFEGIFAKHHGTHEEGYQDYEELVAVFSLRYDHFPWNEYIHTTFAFGEGFSVTSERSLQEIQHRGKTRRLLNYLGVELTFALPAYPRYSLVYRIHHRSGIYGLLGGVIGASDFYVLGLRYMF